MAVPADDCFARIREEQNTLTTTLARIFDGMSKLTGFALFASVCVGTGGIFSASTMGWLTIGLGSGMFALSLAAGKLHDRKITLLLGAVFAAIPIIVGSLGVMGVLSGVQIAWGTLIPILVTSLLLGGYLAIKAIHELNRPVNIANAT